MKDALLLVIFICVSLLYIPLNRRTPKHYFELPIDGKIPALPVFIIPYLLYYPFIVLNIYLAWHTPFFQPMLIAQIAVTVLADIFWFMVPNGVRRTPLSGQSMYTKIINWLYAHDRDGNGFPSGHVFHTLVGCFYLLLAYLAWREVIAVTGVLIAVSTILVKQHYILDILGGIVWATAAIILTQTVM